MTKSRETNLLKLCPPSLAGLWYRESTPDEDEQRSNWHMIGAKVMVLVHR